MELSELLPQNKHNFLLGQLRQHCPNGMTFTHSRPVALHQVKEIYRLLAKRNADMREPIQGFPELIAGLDAFTGDAVVIHSIDCEEGSFKFFADADMREIAGVLKFPKASLTKAHPVHSDLQTV